MKIIFATHNPHKADEIRAMLDDSIRIVTLNEAGITEEIPEPFETLKENASAKSQAIYRLTGADCFSEDTGLEVDALNGAPGVRSARYAGENRSFEENMNKLLRELEGRTDRRARFRTVISLLHGGKEYFFEGVCEGRILEERKGERGFGYDPLFAPEGDTRSFAEMSREEKARFSHRAKAVEKLVTFLNQLTTNH
jgi:XTP/dITP diphosphohydrolase